MRSRFQRLKPSADSRVQLILAGVLWVVGAALLSLRGIGWLMESPHALALFVLAMILGLLKVHFVLEPSAKRAVSRIRERGREQCAGGFFSWRAWVLIFTMMVGGSLLRLTTFPRPALGVLYMTVALALFVGSSRFIRAAMSPRC